MPPPRSANKWNITNHFISPLLFFALGLMVASTMNGSAQHESVTAAPGTQTRLVELMGEINDNEMTISDLKRQLTEQESKCDKLDHELSRTQDELVKAQQAQSAASPVEENWDKEVLEEEKYSKSIAGAQGKNVKWNKVGNWQMTDIEPLSFVKKFDVGLPSETIKWSGGQLLLPGNTGGKKGLENAGSAFDHIENQCTELDVIVLNDQHCVAVTTVNGKAAGQNTPYHISRFLKGGYQSKGRNKAKKSSPKDQWEMVSRLTSRSGGNEGAPPGSYALKTHRKALGMFLNSINDVEKQLKPILTKAARNNVVITMTMNAGMTDMILNFVCSARRAGKSIDHLVLFPTDDEAVEVAKSLGLSYFTHPSFGNFPKEEARSYGDDTFVKMMWIKVLCVFLPVDLGFDVLFQDADVVWFKDPIDEYFMDPKISGDFDVYFQDDGSRSTRFSPYFANSGFYFLRQNPRTRYFMNMLLYSGDTILEWRSHQSALVQVLVDASSKFGLKVKTLSYVDFPSGKDYHHRKPYMQQWLKGEVNPFAFHMCWTQNKVDKVKYLKQLGGWFMDRKCNEDSIRSSELKAEGSLADTCCTLEPVLDCFFKDKASKESCSSSPSKDKNTGSWWPN